MLSRVVIYFISTVKECDYKDKEVKSINKKMPLSTGPIDKDKEKCPSKRGKFMSR